MAQYLALYSIAEHKVEYAVKASDAIGEEKYTYLRGLVLDDEAKSRGGDWKTYRGEKPFSWDIVDPPETATQKKERRKNEILAELSALDAQVPRIVEDILPAISGAQIHKSKSDIIAQKAALRTELAKLNKE
jgi:hypothetical protein